MKKRLLVVDDDDSVRNSLKKVLEESGYEAVLAASADEGERQLTEDGIALMLLDLNMPKRDGWDVLERVNSAYPQLPVVIMTGMWDQLETTIIPGAAALLQKPIEVQAMLKTLETVLSETSEERIARIGSAAKSAPPAR